jgi:hypothetical protein
MSGIKKYGWQFVREHFAISKSCMGRRDHKAPSGSGIICYRDNLIRNNRERLSYLLWRYNWEWIIYLHRTIGRPRRGPPSRGRSGASPLFPPQCDRWPTSWPPGEQSRKCNMRFSASGFLPPIGPRLMPMFEKLALQSLNIKKKYLTQRCVQCSRWHNNHNVNGDQTSNLKNPNKL